MAETLELALTEMFGGGTRDMTQQPASTQTENGGPSVADPQQPEPSRASTGGSLTAQAQTHYAQALDAQRDGDWALYGEEIERLGEILERLQESQ